MVGIFHLHLNYISSNVSYQEVKHVNKLPKEIWFSFGFAFKWLVLHYIVLHSPLFSSNEDIQNTEGRLY